MMKKYIYKIKSFLDNPWTNLIVGIVGFVVIFFCFYDYLGFDCLSAYIGFFTSIYTFIFGNGLGSLIKNKRNSPPSGEDK